jgi:hypothetical protein
MFAGTSVLMPAVVSILAPTAEAARSVENPNDEDKVKDNDTSKTIAITAIAGIAGIAAIAATTTNTKPNRNTHNT